MARRYDIAGQEPFELEYLLLDVNGTLTDRGELLPGVAQRIRCLRSEFDVRLLSADTFGQLGELSRLLRVEGTRISSGKEKRDFVGDLGAQRCVAIGNGRNDAEMFAEVKLGIAVLGPEGLSRTALTTADILCPSIQAALDLLEQPRVLNATLRH